MMHILMKVLAVVLYLMLAFPGVISLIRPEELEARWYGILLIGGYGVFTLLYVLGVR